VAKAGAIEELINWRRWWRRWLWSRDILSEFPTTHPYSFQIAERQPALISRMGRADLILPSAAG
jgi:hypothetical protein